MAETVVEKSELTWTILTLYYPFATPISRDGVTTQQRHGRPQRAAHASPLPPWDVVACVHVRIVVGVFVRLLTCPCEMPSRPREP